jgi:hypothetical protein
MRHGWRDFGADSFNLKDFWATEAALNIVMHLESPHETYAQLYISNYALLQIRDVLAFVDDDAVFEIDGLKIATHASANFDRLDCLESARIFVPVGYGLRRSRVAHSARPESAPRKKRSGRALRQQGKSAFFASA